MLLLHVIVKSSVGLERLVTDLANLEGKSIFCGFQIVGNLWLLFCDMVTSCRSLVGPSHLGALAHL